MSVSRIHRLLRLVTLLQGGVSMSAAELAKDMGVSRRTLFRDLQMLHEAGIPYYHDPTQGYRIPPSFFLPPINLQVTEALGLMLLAKLAETHRDQPLLHHAEEAVHKILTALPAPIREVCREMTRSVTYQAHSVGYVQKDRHWYAQLQRAVDEHRICRMRYLSLFDGKVVDLELHPYHLHFAVRAWYVIGHSSLHKEARTFKLARIEELEVADRRFTMDKPFDVDAHFGKAWALIPEGKVHRVELEFLPMVGRNVAEVRWHPTQQHRLLDDGRCMMTFEVDGLNEISWWLLGYGDQVIIRKPAALRKMMRQIYVRALRHYRPTPAQVASTDASSADASIG